MAKKNASTRASDPQLRVLGGLLVSAAILLNPWSIGLIFAPDGRLTSLGLLSLAGLLELTALVLGSRLLLGKLSWRWPRLSIGVLVPLVVLGLVATIDVVGAAARYGKNGARLSETARLEQLNWAFGPKLKQLSGGVLNLDLPDQKSRPLFEDKVLVRDLDSAAPRLEMRAQAADVRRHDWAVQAEPHEAGASKLRLWRPLIDKVEFFERAKFKLKHADFADPQRREYITTLVFQAAARSKKLSFSDQSDLLSVEATVRAVWRRPEGSPPDDVSSWRIHRWDTLDLSTLAATARPFVDVLEQALPDPKALDRARNPEHAKALKAWLSGKPAPHDRFRSFAGVQHPSISVVDLDRDGFDDFYLTVRLGESMFFHNRGDGTFENIAESIGLNIENHVASAFFADFDNDGDSDVFIGRTLERAMYLENQNGRFVDRSDGVEGRLPYLVTSVSAADYNGDGLLDVYLSTYGDGVSLFAQNGFKGYAARLFDRFKPKYLSEFIEGDDLAELDRLRNLDDANLVYNRYGPPNLLLKNLGGGRFAKETTSPIVHSFRSSFQGAWSDIDQDGDPDLYVVNDFAPNILYRNDGEGRFVDITEETNTADFGFGMGAAWGDYDNDGRDDLYVTNMYSKAGRRLTSLLPDLDPRFAQGARGNSLIHNLCGDKAMRFERVSGLEPPALQVEKGGWGWGGQFVDFDNDGDLDIYALSGFYTAPEEFALPVDT